MKANPIFREKRLLQHSRSSQIAIAELKVWAIPRSSAYPAGRKFSLFLVANGKVILGIDNHRPKGPHLHLGTEEMPYNYEGDGQLIADFWDLVRKAGFET